MEAKSDITNDAPKADQMASGSSETYRGLRVIDQIGERMKAYEREAAPKIDPKLPFIIRIDGHHFSGFTKGWTRPYDARIHVGMCKVVEDLVEQYNPVLGFTQSDEITLVFGPCEENQTPLLGGKIPKICSLVAAYTTIRFTYHMLQATYAPGEERLKAKLDRFDTHFDARVFNVPDKKEGLNNVLWRHLYDCRRNSVSMLGREFFSTKELHKLGTTAIKDKLMKEKQVDWETYPEGFKYGSFAKREEYLKDAVNPKTNEHIIVRRTRVVTKNIRLDNFSEENMDIVFRKFWNVDPIVGPDAIVDEKDVDAKNGDGDVKDADGNGKSDAKMEQ
eukprot:TRINITY_DN6351_c0_g1_i1.p1 TRINITY_DN6351_c0_g1~~TRINITY_DN6351_c0_g1_i1.p1  ORF type:complete len:333 (-),score=101.32 TRINITY_DN6351_c0_g1_i1:15-1013(-)